MTRPLVPQTLDDVAAEGSRLASASAAAGLDLVLIGGVAVWVRCPSARAGPLARSYGDVDMVGRASDRKDIIAFMTANGYEPDKMFNALHGASRLNFHDPARDRPVDVLLDRFSMAHALDLRASLATGELTIPLADLLLTKLQVVTLNEKDLRDIVALLADHDIEPAGIGLERILDVTHSDWGFDHTVHRTLDTVRSRVGDFALPDALRQVVVERADRIVAALDAAPKTARWRMRARVGERVRWYEEPEEART